MNLNTKNKLYNELNKVDEQSSKILEYINNSQYEKFLISYKPWYIESRQIIIQLANTKEINEFIEAYESQGIENFSEITIKIEDFYDYSKGLFTNQKDILKRLLNKQIIIIKSIISLKDSLILNYENKIYYSFQKNDLEAAEQLSKINLRAAGAICGVLIERHLKHLLDKRQINYPQNSTINPLKEICKKNSILEAPDWRKIEYLADIRNICDHDKKKEPSKNDIEELIKGTNWLIKTIN